MILKRNHYLELSWWQWARLRAVLAWSRYTGGFARTLGADGQKAWQAGPLKLRQERSIPSFTTTVKENEMRLAKEICPTYAIQHFAKNGWKIVIPRCISCGLCYPIAPQSLAPRAQVGPILPPTEQEVADFAKNG